MNVEIEVKQLPNKTAREKYAALKSRLRWRIGRAQRVIRERTGIERDPSPAVRQ